jgi:hypothetical protein
MRAGSCPGGGEPACGGTVSPPRLARAARNWQSRAPCRSYDNRLTELPAGLFELSALRFLNAGANQLTAVPAAIERLTGNVELGLAGNRLTELPDAIGRLGRLRELDLRWNPLDEPPAWFAELERRGCVVRLI